MQLLLVTNVDNMETSSCMIAPPETRYNLLYFILFVRLNSSSILTLMPGPNSQLFFGCSFLLNGNRLEGTTNVSIVRFSQQLISLSEMTFLLSIFGVDQLV